MKPTIDYYDRTGQPITHGEWVKAFKDNTVKRTPVGDINVSTIWLGLDHQYGDGPPLIFETMVFGGGEKCPTCGHREDDDPMFRYSTEGEAIAHHDAIVDALRKGEAIPDERNTER